MRTAIIVPMLNEASGIAATLGALRREQPNELIVVDGGSTDGSLEAAAQLADRVILGPRGRALQMNLGAAAATADLLLFIHADCQLATGALADAVRLAGRRGVAAGCFTMHVPVERPLFRSIDWCATARVRLTGIAYGDQGLFIRRDLFERLGGFPRLRFMEDVAISFKLRKIGRIVVSRKRITVSARRWEHVGLIRQTLRNWALTALATVISPDRLAGLYPDVR